MGRTVYVSLALASTVVALDLDGRERQRVVVDTAGGFVAGLAVDRRRSGLAVAVSSPDPAVSGVWLLPLRDGALDSPQRLAALPAGAFPTGLTLDPAGDSYAADSLLETICRVPADRRAGGEAAPAEAWATEDALAPDAAAPGLPGANGLAYRAGALYVSNTARQTLLRVPVHGTSPGSVSVWREGIRVDDLEFGPDGSLYAALNQADQLVRLSPAAP